MTVAGARPLRAADPLTLGGFELLGRLGEGGMGVVYLGRSPAGGLVAVKAVRADLADEPGFRRRFRSEVTQARQVPPYCTAEVLGADPDSDPPYLVVEYVDGPSLADVVATHGPLAPAKLHSVAIGVATALTAIHGAGVIHRDLKPANVLLAQGSLKVIDFGIARPVADASTLTDANEVVGTVAYMAPERFGADSGKSLTPAADIFAWGAVVAYAGTGRVPFRADSMPGVAMRIVHDEPDLDGLPPGLRELVAHALAKNPADRPTARALLDLLTSAGAGTPISVPPALRPPAVTEARPTRPAGPDAVPTEAVGRPGRGRGLGVLAGVVGAVLVLALAVAIAIGAVPLPFGHAAANSATKPSTGALSSSTGPSSTPPSTGAPSPTASADPLDAMLAGMTKVETDTLSPPVDWQNVNDDHNKASCVGSATGLVVTRGSDAPFRCPGPKNTLLYDTAVFVNVQLLDAASCATIWLRFDIAGYAVRVCSDGYHPIVHGSPTPSTATPVCDPVPSPLATHQSIRVGVVLRDNSFSFFRDGRQIGRGDCVDEARTFRVGHVVLGIYPSVSLTSAAPTSQVRLSNVEIWGSTN